MSTMSVLNPAQRESMLPTTHPMDSSYLFMGLLSLVRESDEAMTNERGQQIIPVPVLRRLLSAIHFRDIGTLKHSRRVGLISVGIAGRLGWEDDDLRIIEIAALMHDIGKIGIPDHILRKPGKLSPDEAEFIATYHRVALALLQACQVHPDVTEIVSQSHGVDGEHLRGSSTLSLGARILAVADAYDSLTTRQCYRAPYDRWEALQILEEQSGKQFDRNVVAALGRWLDCPDAAELSDERAAEVSIHVNAPVDYETRRNATQLCQIVNHLYLLENLYDAFYVVDSSRRIVIWSSGAANLFNRSAEQALRKKFNRQQLVKSAANADPMESVFLSGLPVCHHMTIPSADESFLDIDVQSIPILGEDGNVVGVVELICNGKESKQHRGQFRSLQMAATRDPLTGVLNRREFERQTSMIFDEWSSQSKQAFSVVFMDLDHFKSINDRLTHAVGDRVLIECSRLLQDELYSGELVGRYGGEEFVVVCPETNLASAMERAERLRRTLSSTRFAERDDLRVTASFGIAEIQPGETVEEVLSRADKALYEAKRQGRNRTCQSIEEVPAKSTERKPKTGQNDFIYQAAIQTHVAIDMLQMKLTGYVEESKARILTVQPRKLELQMGSAGLFQSWSRKSFDRIPVKIQIDVQDDTSEINLKNSCRMQLQVTIQPVGKCSDAEAFQMRGAQMIDDLKSHLMAD